MKTLLFALAGLCCALSAAPAAVVHLPELGDRPHIALAQGNNKPTVLIFVSPFCPTSNAFTPEANRIAAEYADRVAFYFVEADANLSDAEAERHVQTLGIKAPVFVDRQQRLVHSTRSTTTPEAVVLNAKGEIAYQGRINDLYVTKTKKLKEPKTHDLRNALDAVLAGKPIEFARVPSVGCSITHAKP